jgi:hypothetical protein
MHITKNKGDPPLRTVDALMSQKAQAVWPGALVYYEGEGDARLWTLERPGMEALGLGPIFPRARNALYAVIRAERSKRKEDPEKEK